MKKVILGIGIPGSGKSTLLKNFALKNNYEYICPDDIREEITGNASDQTKNKEVWQEGYRRLGEFLANGGTVVFDATFTNQDQRKSFITFAKENGSEKVEGIFLDTPLDVALDRNSKRERQVPEHVIKRMNQTVQDFPPDVSDGFDSIFSLNERGELVAVEMKKENKVIHREFPKFR